MVPISIPFFFFVVTTRLKLRWRIVSFNVVTIIREMSFFSVWNCDLLMPLVYLATDFVKQSFILLKLMGMGVSSKHFITYSRQVLVLFHSAQEHHQSNFLNILYKIIIATYRP